MHWLHDQPGTHETEGLLGNNVYLLQVEHQTLQQDVERLPAPLPPWSWRTNASWDGIRLESGFCLNLTSICIKNFK